MGAVLGIAAFGRTQEKLNGANNGGISTPSSGLAAPSVSAPSSFNAPVASSGFGAPVSASGFGGSGFGGAPSAPADTGFGQVTTGFGGKPAPIQPPQPLI
jgi:hypothetical protein